MSSTDWTDAVNSISSGSVFRGDSAGFPKPPGGGNFCYGFASQDASAGVVARYCTISGTAPTTKGASIAAAMQRAAASKQLVGYAPFIFAAMTGTDVTTASAYILGLADANPGHIVLRKGLVSGGAPDAAPGQQGVLLRSTDTYAPGTYWHLKLEVVVNLTGDVVINCYRSDLTANSVASPIWTPIPGMAQLIDDALGVNTGSLPLSGGGRIGYGFATSVAGNVAYIDEILPTTQI